MIRAFMAIMGFTVFRMPRSHRAKSRGWASLQLIPVGVTFAVIVAVAHRANGYVLEGVKWPTGTTVTFQLGLGSAGRTLIDGNTSWDTAAAPALTAWDNSLARLQYKSNVVSANA